VIVITRRDCQNPMAVCPKPIATRRNCGRHPLELQDESAPHRERTCDRETTLYEYLAATAIKAPGATITRSSILGPGVFVVASNGLIGSQPVGWGAAQLAQCTPKWAPDLNAMSFQKSELTRDSSSNLN
jgi:hypothetical protein